MASATKSIAHASHNHQEPCVFDQLAAHGLAFTKVIAWDDWSRGADARGKAAIGTGWQHTRHTPQAALEHFARGGNVGVHTGQQPDGRYLYTFDADDGLTPLLAAAPELRESLAVWRDEGSGKILFWCATPLQKQVYDPGGEHNKRELLVSGHAVLAGRHLSGQDYHTNGHAPLVLTADRVLAIWQAWTGQPYKDKAGERAAAAAARPASTRHADDADYALIESAVRALRPQRADNYEDWRNVGFALKAWGDPAGLDLFHRFSQASPKYDERSCDRAWHGFRGSGITVASLIAWAIADAGADVLAWPQRDRIPDPATAAPEVVQRYTALCSLKAHADTPACLVDLKAAMRDAGLTTNGANSAHKVWQWLAAKAVINVNYCLTHLSARRIADATALTHPTVGKALLTLHTSGWLTLVASDEGVTVHLSESLPHTALGGTGKDSDNSLAPTLGDDLYAPVVRYQAAQRRREAAGPLLPALGPSARYVVAALGKQPLTVKELLAASGLGRSACYAALGRLEALNLLVADGERLALVGDFDAKLDQLRTHTVNWGSSQRRAELHLRERAGHVQHLLKLRQFADEREAARLQAALGRYCTEAAQIRGWLQEVGLKPAQGAPWELMKYQRQRERDRRDSRPELEQLAQDLAGLKLAEALPRAMLAGWTAQDVYAAVGRGR